MLRPLRTAHARRAPLWLAAVALGVGANLASAQTALFAFRGEAESGFGETLAAVGDVNGDGCPDFAISDVEDQRGEGAGRVRIHSGCTGTLLHDIAGPAPFARFGAAICTIGDLDGDGAADFAIASGSYLDRTGRVQAFSGRTGNELWTSRGHLGTVALAPAGDLDGDGRPDLLVGARHATTRDGLDAGSVRAISGATGLEVLRLDGTFADEAFGTAVQGLADLDGDGHPDFAIGAPVRADRRSPERPGAVHVVSGKSGKILSTLRPGAQGVGLGSALAPLGDLDGDGVADLAVGAVPKQPGSAPGAVFVFSMREGRLLRWIEAPRHDQWFGSNLVATADVDHDGKPDFAVASYDRVYLFGSASWQPVREITPAMPGARNRCYRIASLGDLNGDGVPELGITSRANTTTTGAWLGAAQVVSTNPLALSADAHEIQYWKGGTQRLLLHAGRAYAGRSYTIFGTLSGTAPGTQKGSLKVPLNLDRYLVTTLQLEEGAVFQGFRGNFDEDGKAHATINLPPLGSAIQGLTAHHAFVIWDADREAFTSNAVPLTFVK